MINYVKLLLCFVAVGLIGTESYSQGSVSNPGGLLGGADNRPITTAVPFLGIAPDARSGAMGDVGIALSPDANSIHWNGSKLAFMDTEVGFSVNYTPWLSKIINDMSLSYLSGYYKLDKTQAVGVSLRYFDLGSITFRETANGAGTTFNPREVAIDATYSRKLSDKLGVGVAGRYVSSNLTGNFTSSTIEARPGNSIAVDFSMFYKTDLLLSGKNSNLGLGATITNIGRKITYLNEEDQDFIHAKFGLGGAFTTDLDPYNTITFALDLTKLLVPTPPIYQLREDGTRDVDPNGDFILVDGLDPDRPLLNGTFSSFGDAPGGFSEELQEVMISIGLEYWYNNTFAARLGYFNEHEQKGNRKYFTAGLGFRYQVFGIDFAYLVPTQQNHPLAETLRFSLLFNFGEENDRPERTISE